MKTIINSLINFEDFDKLDIRTGTIIEAKPFPEAYKPAYQLIIDFGELGEKKSSAQITQLYTVEGLIGKQIIAVVNFKPKQIANFMSDCLVLGVYNGNKQVVLLQTEQQVQNGAKIS